MITRSDAGVTCCCNSKRPKWACDACGMSSTRRTNVVRHISRFHDGVAEPQLFVQYMADLSSGGKKITNDLLPQNRLRTNGERLAKRIENYEENQLSEIINKVRPFGIAFSLRFQAKVCENCMSLHYDVSVPKLNFSFIECECSLKRVFDTPTLMLKHKKAVIECLEKRIGISLYRLMTSIGPSFQFRIHIQPDQVLNYMRLHKHAFEQVKASGVQGEVLAIAEICITNNEMKEEDRLHLLQRNDEVMELNPNSFLLIQSLASQNNGILRVDGLIFVLGILKRNMGKYRVQSPGGDQYYDIEIYSTLEKLLS